MFFGLRQTWNRWRFSLAAEGVRRTKPIHSQQDGIAIVSSVSHLDLMMYLVAIKSFHHFFPRGKFIVLDDGTLNEKDKSELRNHLVGCEIRSLDAVPYSKGKKGVRWGIMLAIADLVQDHFVIQVDSDTVTRSSLDEVQQFVAKNCAFTLGTQQGRHIESVLTTSNRVKENTSTHVQVVAEQNFVNLPDHAKLKYVRGNSGLAGFAKGAFDRNTVESFLEQMTTVIGDKWRERGSFQVTSNIFVANCPSAEVLPLERYACVTPEIDWNKAAFLHFIGRFRFKDATYSRMANQLIKLIS